MESYIQVLQKPEFVLSAVLAIGLMLFQPIFENLRSRIVSIILDSSKRASRLIRNSKAKSLKSMKTMRRNDAEIMYQIARNFTFLLLFIGAITFYLAMLVLGPLEGFGTLPLSVQYFITAPIYICEVLWLLQNAKTRELILHRGKLNLTRS